MTDLLTLGETMLRLSVPTDVTLSRADRFDVHVGGAESNVAVAAAALGVDAVWVSAVPDTPPGERIVHAIRGEGVEPLVSWTDGGRVGTYYFEGGPAPRGERVVYDRAGTPVREFSPEDLPDARVREASVAFASGITPALSPTLAATTAHLFETAREAGTTTALDVNYRSKLWSPASARETLTDLFPDIDWLFVAERDAREVLDCEGDPETIARALRERHGFETVVLTQGDAGALAVDGGAVHEQAAIETDTLDPVGSGDAFVGAYLATRLQEGAVPDALGRGAATAALKRTIAGDMATVSPAAVDAALDGDGDISR